MEKRNKTVNFTLLPYLDFTDPAAITHTLTTTTQCINTSAHEPPNVVGRKDKSGRIRKEKGSVAFIFYKTALADR